MDLRIRLVTRHQDNATVNLVLTDCAVTGTTQFIVIVTVNVKQLNRFYTVSQKTSATFSTVT